MKKVTFLVDGFNLYHSVRRAQKDLKVSTKWLNIRALCESILPSIRSSIGCRVQLQNIYYFSAYAYHLKNPDIVIRHQTFVKCLEDTGIKVEINRFKYKEIECPFCKKTIVKHEEKETDVSIALKLIEIFFKKECDIAVLITGDTDLAPAVRTARTFFPENYVCFAFPAYRKNKELFKLCPESSKIKPRQYAKFQFPDTYVCKNGSIVLKPDSW